MALAIWLFVGTGVLFIAVSAGIGIVEGKHGTRRLDKELKNLGVKI